MVGVLPVRIVKSNVSSIGPSSETLFLSDEGSTPETLDFAFSISAVHQAFYISLFKSNLFNANSKMFPNPQTGIEPVK